MENFTTKLQIGNLEGKVNWPTWKYKISILMRGTPGAMDVVEGKLTRPAPVTEGAGDAELSAYRLELANFTKTDSTALLLMTTNMNEDTLRKVMRYTTAREVWLELHRLYDGVCEDRTYNLCMQFFGYKKEPLDDIATHLSKLKNIWNELNQEIVKGEEDKKELPELLLICKILDTLGERYFSFRSSWLLMAKEERTVENLTSHLCAYERALTCQAGETSNEALVTNTQGKGQKHKYKKKDEKMRCNYCSEIGHRVRRCQKWIKDGRPPKSTETSIPSTSSTRQEAANMSLMTITSCVMAAESDKENWYIDNGATSHITNRNDLFQTFERFDQAHTVTTANGDCVRAEGKGSIEIESNVNGVLERIILTDVWYVPLLKKNLFSVLAAHDRKPQSIFSSTTEECRLSVDGKIRLVGKRCRNGGLYKLNICSIFPNKPVEVNMMTATNLMQLYHERLAHQNKRHVKELIKRELGIDLFLDQDLCEGCIYGKAHRLKFGTRERATQPGELMHSDVCGPFMYSISKYRYFVLFKDDYSGYRHVYFMKEKSEVKEKLMQVIAETKVAGYVIKTILSDNGGEFDNNDIKNILNKEGIKQRLTMPYTPEQNGSSERENRTLVETARSIMYAHKVLPQGLWAELINTAAYILNRTGATRFKEKTPYELWYRKKPNIKHLRIIGSTCYVHVPKQKRKKFGKKAEKGILVGYDNDDGYRIWIEQKYRNRLVRSRDIIFDEKILHSLKEVDTKAEFNTEEKEKKDTKPPEIEFKVSKDAKVKPTELENDSLDNVQLEVDSNPIDENDNYESVEFERDNEEQESDRYYLRSRSTLHPPKKFNDYIMSVVGNNFITQTPLSFNDAIESQDKEKWLVAMENEMSSLRENNT